MKIHPLKIYLLQNKIKQKEFSQLSGIPQITIHRIINYKNKGFPRKETIEKIHKLTNIPRNQFTYQENDDAK